MSSPEDHYKSPILSPFVSFYLYKAYVTSKGSKAYVTPV